VIQTIIEKLVFPIVYLTDKGEAVGDTLRERGDAYARDTTHWNLYGYNHSETQKPPSVRIAAFT